MNGVDEPYWKRHFLWSLVGMVVVCFAVAIAASAATAPSIGWTPDG